MSLGHICFDGRPMESSNAAFLQFLTTPAREAHPTQASR
jgi:hypothetical protein